MHRTNGRTLWVAAVLAAGVAALGGCASSAPVAGAPMAPAAPAGTAPVPEIRPGVMAGYLAAGKGVDSLALLPPPPAPGTAAMANDEAVHAAARRLRGTPRWQVAAVDAELMKPSALETFSCALGVPVNDTDTPDLARLLKRTLVDGGLSTYGAKNTYRRTRPFVVHGEDTCLPKDEAALRTDGSYPSGHTAIGWTQALVLAQVDPARADALFQRGRAFGESRLVCNAHWQSDVLQGRVVAAATYALLQSDATYRQDVQLAAADLARARAAGKRPGRDCAAEAAALAMPIEGVL
ncbi:acid phosphatase [Pseudoxanthomonas sp. 10H]|uniref:acid phosphatase n=1 Tax=Pseudoxanthomonas sp. 10H TaxID=3242729 RepID=UPI00355691F0